MVSDISKVEADIPYLHLSGHLSKNFYLNDFTTSASAQTFLMRVGSIPAHILPSLTVSAGTTITITEGVTVSNAGTPLTVYNYNRAATNTPLSTWFKAPTTSGGTVIRQNQAGAGANPGQAVSGNAGAVLEYILKPNTDYLFTHTPSVSATMIYVVDFYEMALT